MGCPEPGDYPHSAGGRPVDPESLIAHNIAALRAGAPAEEYRNRF